MRKLSWRSRAIALAAVAALAAGMGAAYAAIPDGGVIHACYQVNGKGDVDGGSNLRVIDSSSSNKDGQACKKNERSLDFNQQGATGATGATGPTGDTGPQGPAFNPVWGDAQIWITRNANAATPDTAMWADFSTILGSPAPFGSAASGVVRFSCPVAPCQISVKGLVSSGAGTLYPRLVIYRQELFNSTVVNECEYVDGADNAGLYAPIGTTPTLVTLGAGGTLDCTSPAVSTGGAPVNYIEVPQGRYDIHTTFYFKQS